MLIIPRKPKPLIILTCYHTHRWIEQCISGLVANLPDVPLMIVNNNPCLDDPPFRKESYNKTDPYGKYHGLDHTCAWDEKVEFENEFIKTIPNAQIVKTPQHFHHGEAMNYAMAWTAKAGYTIMVHIEPDTIISGRIWYDNLVNAINDGNWMSGGIIARHGEIFSCPTAWNVSEFQKHKMSFLVCDKTPEDLNHPKFLSVFNMDKAEGWSRVGWDTSFKAWFTCAINDKAKVVALPDFQHLWSGSQKR